MITIYSAYFFKTLTPTSTKFNSLWGTSYISKEILISSTNNMLYQFSGLCNNQVHAPIFGKPIWVLQARD